MAQHVINLYSPWGLWIKALDTITSCTVSLAENDAGVLELSAPDLPVDVLARDARIEVLRITANGGTHAIGETMFLVRKWSSETVNGKRVVRVLAFSAAHLLKRRIVRFPAGSAQASKTGAADNLIKAVISENFADLVGNGLLTVQPNASAAASITRQFARRNIGELCSEFAQASAAASTPVPLFYDVVFSNSVFQARTYVGQRGADRRVTASGGIAFSLERGNMTQPAYRIDWTREITQADAGGAGTLGSRLVGTAIDAARVAASPFNRMDGWTGTQYTTQAACDAEALALLGAGRPVETFEADILSTPGAEYGEAWAWGDMVTAEYEGRAWDCRVSTLRLELTPGNEVITAKLRGAS